MAKVKSKGSLNTKKLKEVKEFIKKNAQDELLNLAYEHFLASFPDSISSKGGKKTDKSLSGWEKRQGNPKHPALNNTGTLKNSIDIDDNSVYTDLYYAGYQNYGTERIPAREFIGPSKSLVKKSLKYIKDRIAKILK